MASCMGTGMIVSLAIPVLASIYKGLSVITSSASSSTSPCCFPSHYLFCWMGTYLDPHSGVTSILAGPHMAKYGGLYRSIPYDSVAEARGRLNTYHPSWSALRPRRQTSSVFLDHKPQSYEDVTSFLSQRTNMVGFHFDDRFAVEMYHPHRFSSQFGFDPSIPERLQRSYLPSCYMKERAVPPCCKVARVCATLLQSEDRAAHLRQELNELDAHIEALRDQVTSRESVIVGLEAEKSESVLLISSLEEIIEKGQGIV
ncbi:hypothetical protein LIER_18108 [Lithospermum erythrorhizon]|uniref:Aminotransferase-like plant mobile domain-containing protein n=1 Tax=Lithospermum erythrorhizon TaxID=34254 RepID=A0AAV3QEI4_LITER